MIVCLLQNEKGQRPVTSLLTSVSNALYPGTIFTHIKKATFGAGGFVDVQCSCSAQRQVVKGLGYNGNSAKFNASIIP